ncbi:MAG: tetratricopeptide repeat protein [Candidatus Eremiobacteraeota bacterium]|nr:tetratricopeptide repeat protein [Candidatus Eremiobacteraeota bacterium]
MATKATTTAVTINARLAALCAALLMTACSRAGTPSSSVPARHEAAVKPSNANSKAAVAEIKTGVRAYGHHAYKIALSHFNRALRADPRNFDALYDRSLTEEKLGAFKRAETDMYAAVRIRPKSAPARIHLAAAQYHAHHFSDSARNFDIALRGQPKAWKLWLDDGVSYYHLHRYGDARKRFARALDLSPRSGRAHYWLGLAYGHLGNRPKARAELALAAHSRDGIVRTAARRALTLK